jgi:hypothetical protein
VFESDQDDLVLCVLKKEYEMHVGDFILARSRNSKLDVCHSLVVNE